MMGKDSQITILAFIGQDCWRVWKLVAVIISSCEQHLFQAISEIQILVELTIDYSASGIIKNKYSRKRLAVLAIVLMLY